MKEYRAYVLTSDGAILEMHTVRAMDHDEAIRKARTLAIDRDIELWEPPVLVARLSRRK